MKIRVVSEESKLPSVDAIHIPAWQENALIRAALTAFG